MPGHSSFQLEPLAPFRLDLTVWVLRRRPENIIDRWDGRTYRRVLVLDNHQPLEVAVTQSGSPTAPQLNISSSDPDPDWQIQEQIAAVLRRMLGLDVDLGKFYRSAARDDRLKPLADRFCGFKPPRFPSSFEALVNAIACQQLTLTLGIRLLNRLTEAYGPALQTTDGVFHAFPRPQDLADVDLEALRAMGYSYQKARYITGIARLIANRDFNLDELSSLDDTKAVERLRSLKGVGRWSAEYVLLRGLGRTHVFPADDVGARNNLERWLGLSGDLNYDRVHEVLKRWDGFGGLVYLHLLLGSLADKGALVS